MMSNYENHSMTSKLYWTLSSISGAGLNAITTDSTAVLPWHNAT